MSILSKFKKKPEQADVTMVAKTIANVKKMIDLKLISVSADHPGFSLYPEIWTGKDLVFKNNCCKNILLWRSVTFGRDHESELTNGTMKIENIESGELIGTYSKKTGLIEF